MNRPAQLVFRQVNDYTWHGNLLNHAVAFDTTYADCDSKYGKPGQAAYRCTITGEKDEFGFLNESGMFTLVTQGPSKHSRTYSRFATLTDAQMHAVKWAGRRFKVN